MQITALMSLLLAMFFFQQERRVDILVQELSNQETTKTAAAQIIETSRSEPELKDALNIKLPRMLTEAKNADVLWSEANVAGNLKILTALPALVKLLDQPNLVFEVHTMTREAELHDDPIGRAIYEIGEPAVSALWEPLESKNSATRVRAIRILLLMNTQRSHELLETHLPKENDADLRRYLIANGIGTSK